MNRSESITDLAIALSAAQAEMSNPAYDKKNSAFGKNVVKPNYASLASVRNSVLPVLNKHGLSVIQDVYSVDGGVCCTQILIHKSGQFIETKGITVPADKNNAHGYGSATTYARRFSLMALACVVGDEDDDGNAAVESTTRAAAKTVNWLAEIENAKNLEDLQKVFKKAWTSTEGALKDQCKATYDNMKIKLQDEAMEAMQ